MNEIFRDMLHRFVLIYIDDILIYSPNITEQHRHVTQNSRDRSISPGLLSQSSKQLEPVSALGGICPEFATSINHRINTLSVRSWVPATTVSLERGALGGPGGRLLVPGEREGMGLSSRPSPAGSSETQVLR